MPSTQRVQRVDSGQGLQRELADCLEHPEAGPSIGIRSLIDEVLLDQRAQTVQDVNPAAAARSTAGAGPSRPCQIAATAAAFSPERANRPVAARARATKSVTDSFSASAPTSSVSPGGSSGETA